MTGPEMNVEILSVGLMIYWHLPQRAAAHRPETSGPGHAGATGAGVTVQPLL